MNILEDLWYGNLSPMEQLNYRTEEYRELLHRQEKNQQKLLPSLNAVQKEDLQNLWDVEEKMHGLVQCAAFMSGFRMAVQIMSAALSPHSI